MYPVLRWNAADGIENGWYKTHPPKNALVKTSELEIKVSFNGALEGFRPTCVTNCPEF
jgi:hypothetical protein